MRILAIALCLIAFTPGCVTPPPRVAPVTQPFNAADIKAGPGFGSVSGQVFLTTRGGDVKLGAGRPVELVPITPYTLERFNQVMTGQITGPRDPALLPFILRSVTDAEGRFTFDKVPSGGYHVASMVTWEYFDGHVRQNAGGQIVVPITVVEGERLNVVVTR